MYHSLKSAYGYAVRNHFEDTRFLAGGREHRLPTRTAGKMLRELAELPEQARDQRATEMLQAQEIAA